MSSYHRPQFPLVSECCPLWWKLWNKVLSDVNNVNMQANLDWLYVISIHTVSWLTTAAQAQQKPTNHSTWSSDICNIYWRTDSNIENLLNIFAAWTQVHLILESRDLGLKIQKDHMVWLYGQRFHCQLPLHQFHHRIKSHSQNNSKTWHKTGSPSKPTGLGSKGQQSRLQSHSRTGINLHFYTVHFPAGFSSDQKCPASATTEQISKQVRTLLQCAERSRSCWVLSSTHKHRKIQEPATSCHQQELFASHIWPLITLTYGLRENQKTLSIQQRNNCGCSSVPAILLHPSPWHAISIETPIIHLRPN